MGVVCLIFCQSLKNDRSFVTSATRLQQNLSSDKYALHMLRNKQNILKDDDILCLYSIL